MQRLADSWIVNALHKLISVFVLPLLIPLIAWAGFQFMETRDKINKIETAISIQVPYLDRRVTELESWVFRR